MVMTKTEKYIVELHSRGFSDGKIALYISDIGVDMSPNDVRIARKALGLKANLKVNRMVEKIKKVSKIANLKPTYDKLKLYNEKASKCKSEFVDLSVVEQMLSEQFGNRLNPVRFTLAERQIAARGQRVDAIDTRLNNPQMRIDKLYRKNIKLFVN